MDGCYLYKYPDDIVFVFVFQHWKVFNEISEIFILVPALLGLKGNLEMTLASRLSTAVSVLYLYEIW